MGKTTDRAHNPALPFINPDWLGNEKDSKGRFKNLDGHSLRGFKDMIRWKWAKNPFGAHKKEQASSIEVVSTDDFFSKNVDGITWIGHATFVFTISGKSIITDPVLGKIWPLKRYTDLPCPIDRFKKIDYILLSHNHRDHCDKSSLVKLCAINPEAIILTGLEIGKLLQSWGIANEIQEAGWFQKYELDDDFSISYLPTKHWNRRYLHDLNTMLWGSFMIEQSGRNLYFGGDSGYGIHYQEISRLFPKIDIGILGIGAYQPRWFMKSSHTSPADVIKIKDELNIDKVIPMHYGTFDLSDEPVDWPEKELKGLVNGENDWVFLDIGRKYII